jgi:transposase-like protein
MSDSKTRKVHGASFKAKVTLEAVREIKTLNEIGQEHGVHPVQVNHWKKALLEKANEVFESKRGPQAVSEHGDAERLYSKIGRTVQAVLTPLVDWLAAPEHAEPRRTFVIWLRQTFPKYCLPGVELPQLNELEEMRAILSERIVEWTEQWKKDGLQQGLQKV